MRFVERTRQVAWVALLAVILAPSYLAADELDNPTVPSLPTSSRPDANSVRVALVDSGVNYLLPEIAASLARDENGALVGYDFWDLDDRPFDSHPVGVPSNNRSSSGEYREERSAGGRTQDRPTQGRSTEGRPIQRHGTRTASILIREAPFAQLVAYRYPRPDMQRMTDLVAHADRNNVRVIGLPLGGNKRDQWLAFESAAKAHPNILFVASAGNNGRDIDRQPVYPASLTLDNMLVVSSADDFGRVAQGVNWGRVSVDYMVPAEQRLALGFDGNPIRVSGSSYAVPRVVALAARYFQDDPQLTVPELLSILRSQFANGVAPRQLAQGFLYDPLVGPRQTISVESSVSIGPFETTSLSLTDTDTDTSTDADASTEPEASTTAAADANQPELSLPLQLLVLDERWSQAGITLLLKEVGGILEQCRITLAGTQIELIHGPDYVRDLEVGSARTLMEAVRSSGPERKLTVVFASDTRMSIQFDAEAFGRGNTRFRPWLTDSVWLTLALEDRPIALAHEMFHVLLNSGEHSTAKGSLMLARTTGDNTVMTNDECGLARTRALGSGLVSLVN